MKKPLLLAFAAALGLQVQAQSYVPISLTGFTADVIADGTGPALNSTSEDVDGVSYNFVAQNYKSPTNQTPPTFLPANGTINSAATPGLPFQLAPYTGNNSLRITTTTGSGTLTFVTPRAADQIYLLVTSAYGCTYTATVNYTDGTNQAFTGNTLDNWFFGTSKPIAIKGISRVLRTTDAIEALTDDPRLYQIQLTPNAANIAKLIQSITFTKTATPSNSILHVFGVTTRAVFANDISVTAITGATSQCGLTNQENVCITIQNNGTAPQTTFPVSYTINGGTPVTETFTGNLAPGATANYCFTTKANMSTPGNYVIQACANLASDQLTTNNCATKTIASIPTISTFPYFQNFETNDGGWIAGGTNSTWALGTPAKTVINSAASGTKAWVTSLAGSYNANEKSEVVSPCFNLSTLVKPVISMKIWWQTENSFDGAVLQSSIDGGVTWQNVGAKGDPNSTNWFNDNTINGAPGGQPAATAQGWSGRNVAGTGSVTWVSAKHELTGLGGKPAVRFRIAFGSEGTNQDDGVAFDDINIFESPQNETSITAVTAPLSGCGLSNQETVTATIKNFGLATLTSIPVTYTINNGTPVTETWTGSLAPNATANFSFATKANLSAPGEYTIKVCTALPGDPDVNNDCSSVLITSLPYITTYPYFQDFEGTAYTGWIAGGTNSTWALGTPAKTVINSAASGTKSWVTSLTGLYNNSENSQVTSPCFNLSTLTKPVITLKIWWNSEFSYDGAVLQSSIDGGTTWQNVGAKGDPINWYNDNTINGAPGGQTAASAQGWTGRNSTSNGSGGWISAKHELVGLGGKPNVRFRIAFGSEASGNDNGFAFDDINIFDTPQNETSITAVTTPLSGCGLTNQETITATIKNLGLATLTTIPVTYTINNGTPVTENWTGSLAPNATANFSFATKANLSAPGEYTIKVCTALGGDPDASNDCSTILVKSLPTIATYPYFQDFEGTAYTGWLASGTNSSWALGTPAKTVINSAGSGTNSWVTSVTGTYNANEQSAVVSPCLNFSMLQKPLMEMKVWWSSQTSFDGAVLQSSIDNGQTWINVGAFGEANWYNDNTINGAPGGQPAATAEGWSGTGTASSNGWITVKHPLSGLQLKPNVRLRIAFGSDATTQNDGFAFDDIKIYDTPANDVGVIGINQLASGCGLSNTQPITITIRNYGLAPQTSIPVSYSLDGVNFVNETITGINLAPNTTQTYTFTTTANLSVAGMYTISACTKLTGDGDATNDCKTISVRSIPTITSYPYFQDFETNDGGWVASGTNSSWALGTPNKLEIKGAASGTKAFVTSLTGTYNNSENSMVLGPCFNFSTLTNPQIDMKVWWHSEFSMDGAVLQSSTDNGVNWSNVGFNQDPGNWYNDGTIIGAPGSQPAATAEGWTGHQVATSSNGWVRARHQLAGLGGQANVKLRIAFGSNATTVYDGFAFDDILIYEKPANDAAVTTIIPLNSGCGISNQETVTILVENAGTNNLTGVPVNFKVDNGAFLATPETTPAIAAGGSITYTFIAKANLSAAGEHKLTATTQLAGDQVPQNNAVVIEQSTIPTITTYPYTQNFENGDGGWKASGTFSSWALGKPAKTVINSASSGNNAWVTSLNGTYNINENSRVLGPCFNFTNLTDPVFQMKAWWNAQASFDGAVLQSSVDNGTTWQNVGAKGDANSVNWFNDNTINAAPGGQPAATAQGWTGTTATTVPPASSGWVIVRHALTGLAGQSNVKLRIAFAADATTQNDGFAFDDILIEDVSNNVAVTAVKPLVKICGFGNNEQVEVTLANLSNTAIASGINLKYTVSLNGNLIYTSPVEPYATSLVGNTSAQHTFQAGADLTLPGSYLISVTATIAGDPDVTNNTTTYTVANTVLTSLPQGFNFETTASGLGSLRAVTASKSAITENTAASSTVTPGSTKGIIMDAVTGSPWTLPILTVDPWTNNLNNKSGVYMCLPAQAASDSLWLLFDLKQTYKTSFANTNFRVTVNGNMVGTTYRPAVDGTPDVWKTVKVNLTQFKNNPIQIGLESSTSEAYQNGTGPANLVDNVIIRSRFVTGTKNEILQSQLSVFPNPGNGQFNVNLPEGKAYELEVVDLTGRVLKRQSVKGGNSQLDMQGTSQGIYLLKVKSNNATAVRKLIIE